MAYSTRIKHGFERLLGSKLCRTKQLTDANLDEVRKIFCDIVAPRDPVEMDTFSMMRGVVDAQLALKDSIKHSLAGIHTDHFSKYTVDKFAMITGMCSDERMCATGGAHMIMFASGGYIVSRLGLPVTLNIFYRDRSGTFVIDVRDERTKRGAVSASKPQHYRMDKNNKQARSAPEPSNYFASALANDMRESGDCRTPEMDLGNSSDDEPAPAKSTKNIDKNKSVKTKTKTMPEPEPEPQYESEPESEPEQETKPKSKSGKKIAKADNTAQPKAKKPAAAKPTHTNNDSDSDSNSDYWPEPVNLPKGKKIAKKDDLETHTIVADKSKKNWGSDDDTPDHTTKKTK